MGKLRRKLSPAYLPANENNIFRDKVEYRTQGHKYLCEYTKW